MVLAQGRYLCPCGITGIYYDASADYHLCRSGNAYSHDWLRLRLYFLRDGAFFAITGALCAYLIVHIFAGTAETILAGVMALVNFESVSEHVAMQHNTWMVGVGMVVVFGLLNAIGVEVFGKVEVFLTFGMWTTLTIFGLCGILLSPVTHHSGWFGAPLDVSNLSGLFGYIGMAMFMFVGCELVTPMAPEIKKRIVRFPERWRLAFSGGRLYVPLWRCD